MSNDPSSGEQPGWQSQPGQQGQQGGYPGYGQPRADQPGYGASYPPPTQQGAYGQTPSWQQPAAVPPQQPQGASAWSGGATPGGAYPAGMGPGGHMPSASSAGFFGALFDFGFNSFATPVVIKVLYILSLVGIGVFYVVAVISGFVQDPLTGLLALVGGGIAALLTLVYIRVLLEVLFATIRIAEDVRILRDRQQ